MRHTSKLIASMVLASVVAGSEAWAQRTYVRVPPPPARVEVRGPAPRPGLVWQPGYYRWRRDAYRWRSGRWVRPPARRAVWVAPRWEPSRRGWYSTPGHWRW